MSMMCVGTKLECLERDRANKIHLGLPDITPEGSIDDGRSVKKTFDLIWTRHNDEKWSR